MEMDINMLMKDLANYTRFAEEIAGIIDSIKDDIKAYMDAAGIDTVIGAEHKATYKQVTSARIDTSAIKKELPDIAARYTKTTTARRFTFT